MLDNESIDFCIDFISNLLTKDLDFYHVSHSYGSQKTGKELFLYSKTYP